MGDSRQNYLKDHYPNLFLGKMVLSEFAKEVMILLLLLTVDDNWVKRQE